MRTGLTLTAATIATLAVLGAQDAAQARDGVDSLEDFNAVTERMEEVTGLIVAPGDAATGRSRAGDRSAAPDGGPVAAQETGLVTQGDTEARRPGVADGDARRADPAEGQVAAQQTSIVEGTDAGARDTDERPVTPEADATNRERGLAGDDAG